MNLLLDSHVLLWYDQGDKRFPQSVLQMLDDTQNRVLVSVVTIWELAIKRSVGKMPEIGSIQEMILRHGFEVLALLPEHAEGIVALPRHHGDPFDHLLMAQAIYENLTLVTHDRTLMQYTVPILVI